MKLEFDWNVLAKYEFLRGRWIWEPDDFQKQAGWKHDPVFCAYQVAPDGWRFHQCSRKAKHTIGTMDGENHGYCKQHFYMVKSELADRGLILVNLEVDEDGQLQANVLEPKPELPDIQNNPYTQLMNHGDFQPVVPEPDTPSAGSTLVSDLMDADAKNKVLTTAISDLSAAGLMFLQELDRFEHDTLTTAAIEKFRAAVQKALKLTAGAILLLAFILLSTTTAHAQERYDALEQPHYGPLSATAAARQQEIIRRHYDLSATAAAAPDYFSRYENTVNPDRLYGHAWGVEQIKFDFLTGYEWTDKARQCEFVIGVHSPPGMPHAEAFPVINAQYYTPVFVPGLYWSYQYDSFFENDDWFFIHLNGPPIEGTAGNEGWIRWWLDISHAPLVNKDFYMNHWTTWYNTAYCQDEDFGDPWYFWHTYVVFVDEHGHPHYNYLFLPSIN